MQIILQGLKPTGLMYTPLNGDKVYKTKTISLGGGEWCIVAKGKNRETLFEAVGSNGTREPAEDLWDRFYAWAKTPAGHPVEQFEAPDGDLGSYEYFLDEVEEGRLHGLVVTV